MFWDVYIGPEKSLGFCLNKGNQEISPRVPLLATDGDAQIWLTSNFLSSSNTNQLPCPNMTDGDGMKMNEPNFPHRSEQNYTIMGSIEKFWKLLSQQSSNSLRQWKNWKHNMLSAHNPSIRFTFCYICFIFLLSLSLPLPSNLSHPIHTHTHTFLLNHLK